MTKAYNCSIYKLFLVAHSQVILELPPLLLTVDILHAWKLFIVYALSVSSSQDMIRNAEENIDNWQGLHCKLQPVWVCDHCFCLKPIYQTKLSVNQARLYLLTICLEDNLFFYFFIKTKLKHKINSVFEFLSFRLSSTFNFTIHLTLG